MNTIALFQVCFLLASIAWIAFSSLDLPSKPPPDNTIKLTYLQLEKKAQAILQAAEHQASYSPCMDVFALEPLQDPWGRYVRCHMDNTNIILTSAGPDREFNSKDDLDFRLSSH
jgi:hypothetical protein